MAMDGIKLLISVLFAGKLYLYYLLQLWNYVGCRKVSVVTHNCDVHIRHNLLSLFL
jgi:hypothetical protein